jgi:hypothetical protein
MGDRVGHPRESRRVLVGRPTDDAGYSTHTDCRARAIIGIIRGGEWGATG